MRELAAQLVPEQQIVQRNHTIQYTETHDADEENPREPPRTMFTVTDIAPVDFGCVSRSARGINAATIAATAVSPSNQ